MRKPGGATAWIVDDRTDLPRGNHRLHDLWIVGGTVVQALRRRVAAYRLSDGAEVWSVPLPSAVCETPANPTTDGKVVLVRRERADDERGNRCSQLQMIDLKTGKQGWHEELPETGSGDNTFMLHPLRAETGKAALVHESAALGRPGRHHVVGRERHRQ